MAEVSLSESVAPLIAHLAIGSQRRRQADLSATRQRPLFRRWLLAIFAVARQRSPLTSATVDVQAAIERNAPQAATALVTRSFRIKYRL